jgi:NAD+ diphosphatase
MIEITFAGNPLDRAHLRRMDPAWLGAARAEGRFLVFAQGKPLTRDGLLAYLPLRLLQSLGAAGVPAVFLGVADGQPYFALDLPQEAAAEAATLGVFGERGLTMGGLPAGEAAIMAEARGVLNWHATHKFCARCGAPSVIAEGGWKRDCPACKAEHFPRTDPVVIMLAIRGDRALLGRKDVFLPGMYSCLAGFMEPGETIEEAVARELMEEAGIAVGAIRYVASQPWPFPSSLMIGCHAEALGEEIRVDKTEIDDARWFTKDEIRDALGRPLGQPDILGVPPKSAIAHQLMRAWVEER